MYRRGLQLGVGLVVAKGIVALISSGVVDGLWERGEPVSPSLAEQRRVVSADVSGRADVLDGDTIDVGGVRVRLQGLHCPEAGEPGGSTATRVMRGLTQGHDVQCSLTGEQTSDRIVGTCYVGDTDLTAALIREGVCARCPRYDPWVVPAGATPGWELAKLDAPLLSVVPASDGRRGAPAQPNWES